MIIFLGKISSGYGLHSTLEFPVRLYPGSLNVEVEMEHFPIELIKLDGRGVRKLHGVKEAFAVNGGAIKNNDLGDAIFWRATLFAKNKICDCWIMRRMGSKAWRHLELVSEKYLRDYMDLQDEDKVTVQLRAI